MHPVKEFLATRVPATFKDARVTLENMLFARSSLETEAVYTSAYAISVSIHATALAAALREGLPQARQEQAEVAAAMMGMTSVYYGFLDTVNLPGVKQLPAQMRMVSYGQQVQKDHQGFETAALAVSLVNKCRPCIVSHVNELTALGFTDEQFRDLARLAAAVNAVAKVV